VVDQPATFDLTRQPWIGVIGAETGVPVRVGLGELLARAHELDGDLQGHAPTATAALWRVLAIVTYRVTGLDDPADDAESWHARKQQVLAGAMFDRAAASAYLDQHADRFDLFDRDRPWLQDPRLEPGSPGGQCDRWSGLNKLLPGRSSDNSPAVWSPNTVDYNTPVAVVEAIDGLLHTLWYGPAGQVTPRTAGGISSPSAAVSPLRGYLSTHPTGDTLFHSLVAHLVRPTDYRHPAARGPDLAPWETAALPAVDSAASTAVTGVVGQLTRFRHAVLLHQTPDGRVDNAAVTVAHVVKDYPEPVALDPYLPWRWRTPKTGPFRAALLGDLDRAVWRDLDAILADPDNPDAGAAAAVAGHRGGVTVVLAAQERGKGTDHGWALTALPADLAHADSAARATITAAVRAADWAAAALGATASRLQKSTKADDPALAAGVAGFTRTAAQAAYWPAAETAFTTHIPGFLAGTTDPVAVFRATALRTFDMLADRIDRFEHLPRLLAARAQLARALSPARTPKEAADAHSG
jgi:CRISPR system Cascade subunit CasA